MQDQPPEAAPANATVANSIGGGACSLSSTSGSSVAARLKKMVHVQNGAGPSTAVVGGHCENGSSQNASAENDGILAAELGMPDREMVRLLGQHLRSMGMTDTVETLIRESGVRLEHPNAAKFRHNVLAGSWDLVLKDLKTLGLFVEKPSHLTQMKFIILEQKYLEYLEKGQVVDALQVLREELSPLQYNTERVHLLSTFLMFNNSVDLKRVAQWDGSSHQARVALMDKLQSFLPASVMLPPRRLEVLLQQALEMQKIRCPLHNTNLDMSISMQTLLVDHSCNKIAFPCETRQILSDHCDEVWFCQFSHSGRFLATGSKETRVIIWEVNPLTKRLRRKTVLDGHNYGASFFAWSPDDRYLAVVGPEDGPDLWVWSMERFDLKVRVTHSPDDSLSAVAWLPDGKKFVCGGSKGQFYVCDLDGTIVDTWEGVRVRCLWCKKDGKTVLASDTHHRIRSYFFDDMTDKTLIKEDHSLMYFTLNQSDRFALCNVASQGVHLWDLDNKCLVRRYRGTTQGYYAIYSCFGGVNQDFVASGSEDCNVYVWHRDKEEPAIVLRGHGGVVNAVSWNPADPSMMASCSDDGTVRIWGPEGSGTGIDLDECSMC